MTAPGKDQRSAQPTTETTARTTDTTPEPVPAPLPGADAHSDPHSELRDLVRTRDDVTTRARRIVAGQVVAHAGDTATEGEHADRLVAQTRADLLAELRQQEQQEARRQLAEGGRNGEDAVTAVVRGMTAVVRSVVPPALVRPEDLIEAAYGLADQGLRVARSLALSATAGLRDLRTAA